MNRKTLKPLKPCPFCGSKARFIAATHNSSHDGVGFDFEICCTECDMQLPERYKIEFYLDRDGDIEFMRDDRELAVSEWNLWNLRK